MVNPAPGFVKHPDYVVEIDDQDYRVTINVDGEEIARSDRAKALRETSHPVVYYIPMEDIPEGIVEKSNHSTYCPFKGTASYWDLLAGSKRAENALWSYQAPFDEVSSIKGYVAFYASAATVVPR